MRLIARCPTKTDLERTFLDSTIGCLRQNHLNQTLAKPFYARSQFSYNKSATTHLKSVCQQLQEITQLTTFEALIKLSTTSQAQRFHT